jgi:hypothetical protein
VCHTIELLLVLTRGLTDDAGHWLALAQNALDQFPAWSDGALLTAHTRRSQNMYRGPDRWLQLTFDCLGKLAWAAELFASVELAPAGESVEPFAPRDEVVRFEADRHAGCGPTVRPPSPRPPVRRAGLGRLPPGALADCTKYPSRALPTFVPTITANGDRFVAGVPVELTHASGQMSGDGKASHPSRQLAQNTFEDDAPRIAPTATCCVSTRSSTSTRFRSL